MSPRVITRCSAAFSGRPGRAERPPLHVSFVVCIALFAAACSSEPKTGAPAQTAPSTSQHLSIGQLPPIDVDAMLTHTKVLSSDEYEGRAPGTKGEELAVTYLADQFKQAGLQPGNGDGTYIQKVPL